MTRTGCRPRPDASCPSPQLIGLLAVVAAAIGALVVVTLLVLHRPIGTTSGGTLQLRSVPVASSYWLTRGPS